MIKWLILKKNLLFLFSLVVLINLFLAAWYVLHEEQIKIPFGPTINPGIHFR